MPFFFSFTIIRMAEFCSMLAFLKAKEEKMEKINIKQTKMVKGSHRLRDNCSNLAPRSFNPLHNNSKLQHTSLSFKVVT